MIFFSGCELKFGFIVKLNYFKNVLILYYVLIFGIIK
jgi:hypothetical protein